MTFNRNFRPGIAAEILFARVWIAVGPTGSRHGLLAKRGQKDWSEKPGAPGGANAGRGGGRQKKNAHRIMAGVVYFYAGLMNF